MMPPEMTIEAVVTAGISEVAGVAPERIGRDTTFAGLGIDSLDVVECVFRAENFFNLQLPNSLLDCKTVGELIDGVAKHLGEQGQ